jgi:hypothetical protein
LDAEFPILFAESLVAIALAKRQPISRTQIDETTMLSFHGIAIDGTISIQDASHPPRLKNKLPVY